MTTDTRRTYACPRCRADYPHQLPEGGTYRCAVCGCQWAQCDAGTWFVLAQTDARFPSERTVVSLLEATP